MKIIYVSDFFISDHIGGGELNDHELCILLKEKYEVEKIKSHHINPTNFKEYFGKGYFFIVSNFVLLTENTVEMIKKERYVIYEHDHKYIKQRNPAIFNNYEVPENEIINKDFYKKAKAVLCQSKFHFNILKKNLKISNLVNLSGNLWSESSLDIMESITKKHKEDKCSIIGQVFSHKSPDLCVQYCRSKELDFELISSKDYETFLGLLGKNKKFIFLPQSPETLSRVVVEARMMGVEVITNGKVGAVHEPWFKLKGLELINFFRNKREQIRDTIIGLSSVKNTQKEPSKVSIVTSLYKGGKYIERFLENLVNQTYFENCELIIVDANSPDNEYEVIKKYQKDNSNIRYFKLEEDPGIYGCWNYAIKESKYDLISNANLDDLRSPNQIEDFVRFLDNNEHVDLVYSECYVSSEVHKSYNENKDYGEIYPIYDFSKEAMIKCLPGCMPIWRRRMHDKAGHFDENYKFAGDHEMWLRAVDNGSVFWRYPGVHGLYYHNPEGLSTSAEKQKQRFQEEKDVFWKYCHIFGEKVKKQYEGYFSQ